jgi:tripartite-type tricarboxylate transporter receptor subunit TctC
LLEHNVPGEEFVNHKSAIRCKGVAIMAGYLIAAGIAHAQTGDTARNYPVKPIRIVVPFPPSGGNDILGRYIGQKLGERLGSPNVVENRTGADGIIGTDFVAKAAPDGYTLIIASTSYSTNPAIHKLPYDPLKSLVSIAMIGSGPNVIATSAMLPVKSLRELIALARSKPGQLHYATSGVGGFNHLSAELFRSLADINITHVPYRGGGPAMIDVMTGQVEMLSSTLILAIPHIRTGKLTALGVGSTKRSPLLPNVPTLSEAGVPGYESSIWWGVLGPAGIPAVIVNKLNAEIGAILREPETITRLAAQAAEPVIISPEAFGQLIAADIVKWDKVARESGIKAE